MNPPERRITPRFAVQLPLRYRHGAEVQWLNGLTENISSSGVLFLTDRPLDLNTPVEMNLMMPPQVVGTASGRVVCFGRVVRRLPPHSPAARPRLAVTIAEYHLARIDRRDEAS